MTQLAADLPASVLDLATTGADADAPALLQGDPTMFRKGFDSYTYGFRHRLAEHPLFALPRLMELTQAMSRNLDDIYYDCGKVEIGQRWDAVPPSGMTADQLLTRIETAGAWIILRRADKFPGYADILEDCIAEIETKSKRDIDALMQAKRAIVFINSPRRISSYHIDRECNWLLQIAGEKNVHVFDKNDREVLPEQEIEHFWGRDPNAAVYKPQYQDRAKTFLLRPGDGIHIPVGSPHWVQNGDQVSVSLSVNFHYKERLRANIYRANYILRRLGLRPTPPGRSVLRDRLKAVAFHRLDRLRSWTLRMRQ
jgi:ribosomal silencing factor RsfS